MEAVIAGYEAVLHFIANFTVHTLELVGILIIIVGSFKEILHLFFRNKGKHKTNIIIDLGKTLALALEFKMGAEIVNTVIVRNLTELGTLAIVIALRAILSLLIHWEIKNEKKAEKSESDEEKENTAYHEVGHALLAKLLKNCDPLHKVSIIPRGMALGITLTLPEKDHLTMRKQQLLDRISMILGGRVAEELIYGKDNVTTGASNDLEKVSALARSMVTTYGMSEKMGNLAYGKEQEHVFMGRNFGNTRDFSEEIAADIDKEVKKIVDEQYDLAKQLLTDNRDMLEYIAKQLLEKETLDEKEFEEMMNEVRSKRTFDNWEG